MDIEQALTRIEEKLDSLLAHHDTKEAAVDSSQSHDPFAPDQPVQRVAEAQEQSAQELAPPNTGEGDGPGEVNAEVFPDTQAPQPEAVVPSGEPQDHEIVLSDGSTVGGDAPEAAQEPAQAAPAPEPESQDPQAPSEPQSAPDVAPQAAPEPEQTPAPTEGAQS